MSNSVMYYPALFHEDSSGFVVLFPYIENRIAYGRTYAQVIVDAERVIKEYFDSKGAPVVTKDMWVVEHSFGEFVSPIRYIAR